MNTNNNDVLLDTVRFSNNSAMNGGAMFTSHSLSPTVIDSDFVFVCYRLSQLQIINQHNRGNKASNGGGAIFFSIPPEYSLNATNRGHYDFTNITLSENQASLGAALYFETQEIVSTFGPVCRFYNNSAEHFGGAIYFEHSLVSAIITRLSTNPQGREESFPAATFKTSLYTPQSRPNLVNCDQRCSLRWIQHIFQQFVQCQHCRRVLCQLLFSELLRHWISK